MDDDLLREAKALAARSGRTLSQYVQDAVRLEVMRFPERQSTPFELPVSGHGGTGGPPGLDLNDNSAVLEWMESGEEGSR